MTDKTQVTLEGDERLRATLKRAGDEMEHLDHGQDARLIAQRAQARAPKRSGTLARSIYAKDMSLGRAVVTSDLVYAPVIHFGWAAHHIAAQPYLTTAVTDSVTLVESNDLRQVNKALAKVEGA